MKVAIYAIALNEEQFVKRWYESAKEADYFLIADTGSTDNTIKIAEELGVNVFKISINPWRFDDARNASLALIPSDIDYCIALDLDETMVPGWKKHLEVAYKNKVTRPRYLFTTSWNEDGSPGLQFSGIRIHARNGYRWKYAIHEIPEPYRIEEIHGWTELQIEHHPDNNKSRKQYLPLLRETATENPGDDRCSFYYARELYFNQFKDEAAAEFKRHLSLPSAWWKPQRAAACWYLGECDPENAEAWFLQGYQEDPTRRESPVKLASLYSNRQEWELSKKWALIALSIKEKGLDYFCEPWAWGSAPYDILALAYHYTGNKKEAVKYGEMALDLEKNNERLAKNLLYYKGEI